MHAIPRRAKGLVSAWIDLSISKKLSIVVGGMALLIACELFTLIFAMNILSSVRAFVGGESLWSKAQKDAVSELRQYAYSGKEEHYFQFMEHTRVPLGDRKARIELEKDDPDLAVAYQGFVEGRVHPNDILGVIRLFRGFRHISYIERAVSIWAEGDRLFDGILKEAGRIRAIRLADSASQARIARSMRVVDEINRKLTVLEEDFSYVLGEGSRWLEGLLLMLLAFAVLTVGGAGLLLAYSVSRNISNGLAEISQVLAEVARGNFQSRLPVRSTDEIGQVAASINQTTAELEKKEWALKVRDEFVSLASHELKTPLTALKLQMEMAGKTQDADKLQRAIATSKRQLDRLASLVDDLLDLSSIRAGKLNFNFEDVDLSTVLAEVTERFQEALSQAGCELEISAQPGFVARIDRLRMEQVVSNLISNAIKYAPGRPLRIALDGAGPTQVSLMIQDSGPGIPPELLPTIFERFRRLEPFKSRGLGLGLYIVDRIVKAHGGTISVQSSVGQGTTFNIVLPRQAGVLGHAASSW